MKSKLWLLNIAAFLCAFCAINASAQQCITFQPDFSAYANESTDGTKIYTSVTIDGTGDMTIQSGCYNPPNIIHTASADNVIGTTGGWGPGDSGCPDCYFSTTNNQSIVAVYDYEYDFQWEVQVICSVAGQFWGSGGSISLKLTTTYGQLSNIINGPAGNICVYTPACSSGTPTCGVPNGNDYVGSGSCSVYSRASYLSFVEDGKRNCVGVFFQADGPGPCN